MLINASIDKSTATLDTIIGSLTINSSTNVSMSASAHTRALTTPIPTVTIKTIDTPTNTTSTTTTTVTTTITDITMTTMTTTTTDITTTMTFITHAVMKEAAISIDWISQVFL